MSSWQWYQNPKTQYWYRTRPDDWLLSNRIGQDGGRGYQVQLQDFVRDYFKNTPTSLALDVGANMGITAVEYATIFDRVVAFEPIPDVYDQLEMVIQRNQLTNVECVREAIGDRSGTTTFSYRPNNSFASAANVKGNEQCAMNTIDSHQYRQVNFIKIDVEGLETAVIQGAWHTIQTNLPMIQFEYKKPLAKKFGYDIDLDVCERLINIGYTIIDKKKQPYQHSTQLDLFGIPPNKNKTKKGDTHAI